MEPLSIGLIAASVLVVAGIAAWSALKGWQQWLDYKRLELAGTRAEAGIGPAATGRIELADLRERVRKLEAIAAGIDL